MSVLSNILHIKSSCISKSQATLLKASKYVSPNLSLRNCIKSPLPNLKSLKHISLPSPQKNPNDGLLSFLIGDNIGLPPTLIGSLIYF